MIAGGGTWVMGRPGRRRADVPGVEREAGIEDEGNMKCLGHAINGGRGVVRGRGSRRDSFGRVSGGR